MAGTACPPQAKKISHSVRSDDTEQCFTKPARHRDERIYTLYRPIYIGTVKRHRISALLPESRPRKADALPGSFTSIIYVYHIFLYAYSMEIAQNSILLLPVCAILYALSFHSFF